MFFSFVLDVFARRIVGWQFASHMRTDLVLDALRVALAGREHGADVDIIHHSDAGSQYFTQELRDHQVLASTGSSVMRSTMRWRSRSSTRSRSS
ncbi:DDE-type integrase/transposase/recombinase [Patulibacter sp. NPDC049589]|uniref:DDE-type integrase/transposase/recombinase n=1 Tax=Patulibacter sp. NPDC049589 TaxID=3154731 RepID=UPI0034380483